MEVLGLASALWRRRLAVAIGALVALALAAAVGKSPPTSYGLGWTKVNLDTPQSQEVDTDPFGADSLPWRASVMIDLLSTDEARSRLAQRLNIRPDELAIINPQLAAPQLSASLPNAASKAAAVNPAPYVLTIYRSNELLALITIRGSAPSKADAARLVAAAADAFKAQAQAGDPITDVPADETDSDAFRSDMSKLQGFVVQSAAPVRSEAVGGGASYLKALGAAVLVFGFWCVGVAVLPRLARKLLPHPRRLRHARS
jgi:hypothetical protein